ncbi:DUF2812 domain-containing protein [Streptococcus gallolyticus]|nr:DUF2812 domain-containing protein [Streptococcus gallolyticus]MBY5040228.1 DUF2812 domain-containing protein [Streptococcus gallolyticus]
MKKHKIFTSLQDEENWINSIQAQGYRLTKVNPWLASYTFEPSQTETQVLIRLDFRESFKKEAYLDYLTLFADSGWQLIAGSRFSGTQYFRQTEKASSDQIFSDSESKNAFYTRYRNFSYSYFLVFLSIYFSQTTVMHQHHYQFFAPKTWFLTPGIWDRQGYHFWVSFLFELPFAIGRSGIFSYFFLILAIFYFQIAYKSKTKKS